MLLLLVVMCGLLSMCVYAVSSLFGRWCGVCVVFVVLLCVISSLSSSVVVLVVGEAVVGRLWCL